MTPSLEITILGCGPSGGVPLAGYATPFWGDCDPLEPRNTRTRASIYVRYGDQGILVDTGPDLRHHLLTHSLMDLAQVIITHDHADHVHGLDDLRPVYFARGRHPIPLQADPLTLGSLKRNFSYLFQTNPLGIYPKVFTESLLPSQWLWQDMRCQSFHQNHGTTHSMGLRFGSVAYSTDFVDLDDHALRCLQNLDVWIVDCLGRSPKPTHCHLEKTLMWIEKVQPKKAILTHMNHELDYTSLCKELPPHIRPAYDGQVIMAG